jgi:1,4-alpha-glucan branching enzyme
MQQRADRQRPDRPMSIYEVHLGSWRRHHSEDRPLTYREIAPFLATYASTHGFTHVEFLPLMEHPFTASWGYQVTGFFQPTARYGTADDLRFLIDHLHQYGIGVILDWVPAHFPADRFALAMFDGMHLYEHADPREGRHPDWGSLIFNYSRNEVRSFLLSSACWWIESFHADGLRVDAVASMLYRDYSRAAGEWVPNVHGGRENLEAISLLRACNEEIHHRFPGVLVIAEESTSWPGVTAATEDDGLGFDLKWDLGWMHDTLDHLRRDPVHRRWHHDELTFRQMYASSEQFLLALSHDEVVHGKGSLLSKMPGDDWQQRATLRLLFAYQHLMQGKKLVFMGGEFGQRREWNHDTQLEWELLEYAEHAQLLGWVTTLNELHARCPALHQLDHDPRGFAWISCDDSTNSVVAILRRGLDEVDDIVAVCNFTPAPHEGYRIGMPHPGAWELLASSDDMRFGGSGQRVPRVIEADGEPLHGFDQSAFVNAVPLGVVLYRRVR